MIDTFKTTLSKSCYTKSSSG